MPQFTFKYPLLELSHKLEISPNRQLFSLPSKIINLTTFCQRFWGEKAERYLFRRLDRSFFQRNSVLAKANKKGRCSISFSFKRWQFQQLTTWHCCSKKSFVQHATMARQTPSTALLLCARAFRISKHK